MQHTATARISLAIAVLLLTLASATGSVGQQLLSQRSNGV